MNIFKTITDNLQEFQKNAESTEIKPIWRIHYNDNGAALNKIFLTTASPLNVLPSGFIELPKNETVMLTFFEKEPGVISTRKNKAMQLESRLLTKTMFLPKDLILTIERLDSVFDMEEILTTLSGLLNKINEGTKAS
jgi:hypothetical protein